MKKRLLLILIFITMFFIGSNNVFATLKCEVGEKDCTVDAIEKNLNQTYDRVKLACVYEVKLKKKSYYSYIYYFEKDNKIYAHSTLDSWDVPQVLQKKDNAWLLGDAYEGLYEQFKCPKNSYIDKKSVNEVCFDNDGECKNNGNKLNGSTDFTQTESSKIIVDNADNIKFKELTYNNSCNKELWPEEYKNKQMCKYRDNENPGEYVLLFYDKNNNTNISNPALDNSVRLIYHDFNLNKKNILDARVTSKYTYGACITTLCEPTYNDYFININNKDFQSSCPDYLYMHQHESDIKNIDGAREIHYKYEFEISPDETSIKTQRFEHYECNDTSTKTDVGKYDSCSDLINAELQKIIDNVMSLIKISIPLLLIGLVSFDVVTIVFGNEKDTSKTKARIIKRIVIAIVIFFVPTLINVLLNLVNDVWETNFQTCGIAVDAQEDTE